MQRGTQGDFLKGASPLLIPIHIRPVFVNLAFQFQAESSFAESNAISDSYHGTSELYVGKAEKTYVASSAVLYNVGLYKECYPK